jgi:hypothetical protein
MAVALTSIQDFVAMRGCILLVFNATHRRGRCEPRQRSVDYSCRHGCTQTLVD